MTERTPELGAPQAIELSDALRRLASEVEDAFLAEPGDVMHGPLSTAFDEARRLLARIDARRQVGAMIELRPSNDVRGSYRVSIVDEKPRHLGTILPEGDLFRVQFASKPDEPRFRTLGEALDALVEAGVAELAAEAAAESTLAELFETAKTKAAEAWRSEGSARREAAIEALDAAQDAVELAQTSGQPSPFEDGDQLDAALSVLAAELRLEDDDPAPGVGLSEREAARYRPKAGGHEALRILGESSLDDLDADELRDAFEGTDDYGKSSIILLELARRALASEDPNILRYTIEGGRALSDVAPIPFDSPLSRALAGVDAALDRLATPAVGPTIGGERIPDGWELRGLGNAEGERRFYRGAEGAVGFSIYPPIYGAREDDVDREGWELYDDDGRGNGDFLGAFETLDEAVAATLDALGLAADAEGPEPDLGAGPIHESPSYRASLRDAGRGRLLP